MSSVLYLYILFSNCFERYVSFNFADEAITILLCLLALVKLMTPGQRAEDLWNRYDKWLVLFLSGFFMTGVLSSLVAGTRPPFIGIVKDIMLVGKFFLCFLCGKLLFAEMDREKMLNRIRSITKVSIAVIFFFGVISLFVNIGMGSQVRFGFRSYQFLYTHYTFLVFAEVVMIAMIFAKKERTNTRYLLMAQATLLMTMRTKAVVFCAAVLLFWFMKNYGKKIHLRYYVTAGIAGLLISWGKIREYLSYGASYNMRNGLYMGGLKLAAKYFPLGSGFCSYGSNLSYEYNRQMYEVVGLLSHQGFEVGKPVISDVFWPYIYGQFGVIGMIFYVGMLLLVFYSLRTELQETDKDKLYGANLIFIYLVLASVAEAVYTNVTGVFSAVLLAIYFRKSGEGNKEKRRPFTIRF